METQIAKTHRPRPGAQAARGDRLTLDLDAIGLLMLIEITFIATFTERFFAR